MASVAAGSVGVGRVLVARWGGDVAFDGEGEAGEVLVAVTLRNWRSASSIAAAVRRDGFRA